MGLWELDCPDDHTHAGVPGEPIPVKTEQEIFEMIDYPYQKPEERNL